MKRKELSEITYKDYCEDSKWRMKHCSLYIRYFFDLYEYRITIDKNTRNKLWRY